MPWTWIHVFGKRICKAISTIRHMTSNMFFAWQIHCRTTERCYEWVEIAFKKYAERSGEPYFVWMIPPKTHDLSFVWWLQKECGAPIKWKKGLVRPTDYRQYLLTKRIVFSRQRFGAGAPFFPYPQWPFVGLYKRYLLIFENGVIINETYWVPYMKKLYD